MKTIIISILSFTMTHLVTAQSIFDQWKELNDFHDIMSVTFHPAEEGNLEPVKSKSGDLVEKSERLSKSAIPSEFKSEKIIKAVKQLEKDSKTLDKMVKKGNVTDEELKKAIYDLHDVFHEIVGLCRGDDH